MSNTNFLNVLTFAEARQPEYSEKKGENGGYIEFGKKNDYPKPKSQNEKDYHQIQVDFSAIPSAPLRKEIRAM
jgi:hypothetical protein